MSHNSSPYSEASVETTSLPEPIRSARRLKMIFVSCLSSAPPMTNREPAAGAPFPDGLSCFTVPFFRPFFFSVFRSGERYEPFPTAAFRSPLWFPAIKRNSPIAARQKFFRDDELSAADQLPSQREDMGYLKCFAAQDQRVGVESLFEPSLSIGLQHPRGVRGHQRQYPFEREAVFDHAGPNLVVERARA